MTLRKGLPRFVVFIICEEVPCGSGSDGEGMIGKVEDGGGKEGRRRKGRRRRRRRGGEECPNDTGGKG
jgi:hypothetical protein